MSWFNKNEYKTFLKQRLKEEKKRFKVALDIEKYRIKKSNCLKYILDQIDLKIDRYIKELPKTGIGNIKPRINPIFVLNLIKDLYGMIKLLKDLLKNILIKNFAIQLNIKTHIFDLSTYKK